MMIIDGKEFETHEKGHPYPNRNYPIGQKYYNIPDASSIWRGAALELGEEEFIFDVPRLVNGGKLINLGDDSGGSAILLAQGLNYNSLLGHVYTVDNYQENQKRVAQRNMVTAGVENRITIINKHTEKALVDFNNGPYSFVFIDACHDYLDVKRDWLRYSEIVMPRGFVAFHDTNQDAIHKVLEEEVHPSDWKLIHWVNRIQAFQRS